MAKPLFEDEELLRRTLAAYVNDQYAASGTDALFGLQDSIEQNRNHTRCS